MGAKLVRALRNFNVENKAHRLIGREKLDAAPMHPGTKEALAGLASRHPEIKKEINKKDDALLSRLKDVYVASTDPSEAKQAVQPSESEEFRAPRQTLNSDMDSIPKGRISVVEVLTILNNHKQSPKTWTAEKIAKEYTLNIKDTQALLEYFRTFDLHLVPPKEKIADK
ncbi:NADH dehydrogenase [ubiquinone] 1 alpha subcomplex assembly factor 4 [Gastrophryne carolinensis]